MSEYLVKDDKVKAVNSCKYFWTKSKQQARANVQY